MGWDADRGETQSRPPFVRALPYLDWDKQNSTFDIVPASSSASHQPVTTHQQRGPLWKHAYRWERVGRVCRKLNSTRKHFGNERVCKSALHGHATLSALLQSVAADVGTPLPPEVLVMF